MSILGSNIEDPKVLAALVDQLHVAMDEVVDRAVTQFEAAGERLIAKAQTAGVALLGVPSVDTLLTQASEHAGILLAGAAVDLEGVIEGITATPGPIMITKKNTLASQ
jgi:hypothetical protein